MKDFVVFFVLFVSTCGPVFSTEPLIVVATIDFECNDIVEIGPGTEDIDCDGYPIFDNISIDKVDEFECRVNGHGDGFCCAYEEIEGVPLGSVSVFPGVGQEPFCYLGNPPTVRVITFQSSEIFSDGFESGSTERWDAESP